MNQKSTEGHFYGYAFAVIFIAGMTLLGAFQNHWTFTEAIYKELVPGLTISILCVIPMWLIARNIEKKD